MRLFKRRSTSVSRQRGTDTSEKRVVSVAALDATMKTMLKTQL